MMFTFFGASREFSRYLIWKLVVGALFLFALGVLILVVPELVVIPLAAFFFLVAFFLLVFAWRVFWTARAFDEETRDYEEASFRELP